MEIRSLVLGAFALSACGGALASTPNASPGSSQFTWRDVAVEEGPMHLEMPCSPLRNQRSYDAERPLRVVEYSCQVAGVSVFATVELGHGEASREAQRTYLIEDQVEITRAVLEHGAREVQSESLSAPFVGFRLQSNRPTTLPAYRSRFEMFVVGTHVIKVTVEGEEQDFLGASDRVFQSVRFGEPARLERPDGWARSSILRQGISFEVPGQPGCFESEEQPPDSYCILRAYTQRYEILYRSFAAYSGLTPDEAFLQAGDQRLEGTTSYRSARSTHHGQPSINASFDVRNEQGTSTHDERRVIRLNEGLLFMHFTVHLGTPAIFEADGQRFFDSVSIPEAMTSAAVAPAPEISSPPAASRRGNRH